MDNGCPKCEELLEKCFSESNLEPMDVLCLDCQLEQAEATMLQAMNQVEELKKKKEKECQTIVEQKQV